MPRLDDVYQQASSSPLDLDDRRCDLDNGWIDRKCMIESMDDDAHCLFVSDITA